MYGAMSDLTLFAIAASSVVISVAALVVVWAS
jgi:hypothetical protein